MHKDKIEEIIVKFMTKSISKDELDVLLEWIEDKENEQFFYEFIKLNYAVDFNFSSFNKEKAKLLFLSAVEENLKVSKERKLSASLKYAVVASIVLIISLPFTIKNLDFTFGKVDVVSQKPILPGSDKAVLTLQDGKHISLGKGKSYKVKNMNSNGENLFYHNVSADKNNKIAYNYLTIPRGGQFFVQLSDGTKVWLNSESKLKYPVSFIKGQLRQIELVYGEAYLEVSSSTNHNGANFRVKSKTQNITVLGTEFNIKANLNSNLIQTTLVEGSVDVNNGVLSKVLLPEQQSIVNIKNEQFEIKKVDLSYEIAWKNGFFMFDKEPLEDIMKTLARWYDVTIEYKNANKRNIVFSGLLNRKDKINELLNYFQKTGEVEFKIKDKIITIK